MRWGRIFAIALAALFAFAPVGNAQIMGARAAATLSVRIVTPNISAVCLGGACTGPFAFVTPATGTLFAISATCTVSSCTTPTFSLPSVATTGCTTGQIAQNSNFAINGTNLDVKSPTPGTISGTVTENIGVVVTMPGATNSGQCFPLVLNGAPPMGTIALDNTIFTGSNVTPDPFYDGTTLIANITGCLVPSCALGGADAAKFRIDNVGGVQGLAGGWHVGTAGQPGARVGPFLMSNGNVAKGSGSGVGGTFVIAINGVAFNLGDPPYTVRSTVTHVTPGTSKVQAAINAASGAGGGTTLVLDAGSYTECSGWAMKPGVDVVSATPQNQIAGQIARAIVSGCGTGVMTAASNSTVYGLQLNNFGQAHPNGAYQIVGTTGFSFINNISDQSGSTINNYGICQSNNTNLNVSWNTFQNFAGNDQQCGAGGSGYVNSHNVYHNCQYGCEGGSLVGTTGRSYTMNFVDRPGTNCAGDCNTQSYMRLEGGTGTGTVSLFGNWISYAAGQPPGFAVELLTPGTAEFARNYFVGDPANTAIEWDTDVSIFPAYSANMHDNYGDGSRVTLGACCGGFAPGHGFYGPYSGPAEPTPNTIIRLNNELPTTTDRCDRGGGTFISQPCDSVQYTAGTNTNFGVPPAFAAGSGPAAVVPPTISGVCLSGVCTGPFNFITPATGTIFTLSSSCVGGSCAGSVFSLPSVATTGCTTAQIANNASFAISGANLNVKSPTPGTISGTVAEAIGIVVTLAGATNTGQCFPLALNGAPASSVSLDNTIFTGTKLDTPNGGDTIVANITGCTPPNCVLGGPDGGGAGPSKFKVVAGGGTGPGGWLNSANGGPRAGPFLMSNGNQAGQANGYNITINGTPFHLGDPAAPSLGTVTALNPGGNVQSALNGAGSGNTVFLNPGTFNTGSLNVPSGVRLVSATLQNQLRSQTGRATVNLGGGTLTLNGSSFVYGIRFTDGGSPNVNLSGGTLTNNVIDNSNGGGNPPGRDNRWICSNGGNIVANWNTFIMGDTDNGCGGASPYTFDRNYMHNCNIDCYGAENTGTGVINWTNNFADVNNVTDRYTGELQTMIENLTRPALTMFHVDNNYILNAGGGGSGGAQCCGGYALSIIGGKQTIRWNYIAGHQTLVEWSPHLGESASNGIIADDNYIDWQNIQNLGTFQNEGMDNTGNDCGGPTSSQQRNREIPFINDVNGHCVADNYIAGSTANLGIPAPFASGAGP